MDRIQKVDAIEERMIDYLGTEEMLLSIIKALDYDTKEDIYKYICQCHDIGIEDITEEQREVVIYD